MIAGFGYRTYQVGIFIDDKHISHSYIHKLFYYSIIFICSIFYCLYEYKRDNNNNKNKLNDEFTNNKSLNEDKELIYHDIGYYVDKNISNSFTFLMLFLYVLSENIDFITHLFFTFGDYWMLELVIMTYLNHKMFQLKIYKHQKLAIYLVSIPFILKSVTIILFFCDENNYLKDGQTNYKYNDSTSLLKSLFVAHAWLFPISMILYFVEMSFSAYIIINIKKIIDLKYVLISKLLIIYGFFGIVLSLFFSLITTFISCGKKNEEIYDIYDYLCKVVDNNGDRFIENFKVYFTSNIWKDLLYTLIGAIGYNVYTLFLFQIVKYLNPIYKSFASPLTFFIQKLILMYQINDNEPIKYINSSFFIDFSSDISAIIGFLIYLEIIELNFYGFNENLRINIIQRSDYELKTYNFNRDSINSENDNFKDYNVNDDNEID